jgi:hypothetical protein
MPPFTLSLSKPALSEVQESTDVGSAGYSQLQCDEPLETYPHYSFAPAAANSLTSSVLPFCFATDKAVE